MNAILIVAVGQCGNQLADELLIQLNVLHSHAQSSSRGHASTGAGSRRDGDARAGPRSPFFAADGKARLVLVDSEPKVVRGVQSRHPDLIRPESVVCGQSGRGNNWGLGYYGVNDPHSQRSEHNAAGARRAFRNLARGQREEDDSTLSKALRAIHMETRRTTDCQTFEAIVVLHSLAGGTGSGLASRLCEKLRLYFVDAPDGGTPVDELYEDRMSRLDGLDGMLVEKRRARYLLTASVAPQAIGELATQGINVALTLRVLMRSVDAVLLLRNDDALAPGEGRKSSSTSSGAGDAALVPRCITFREVNEVLVSLLLPVLRFGEDSVGGVLGPVVRQCTPSPLQDANVSRTGGNKILTLLPTPQRVYSRFRECVLRGRFYTLQGGRDYLGGSMPTVPLNELLSHAARLAGGGDDGEDRSTRSRGRAMPGRSSTYGGGGMMMRDKGSNGGAKAARASARTGFGRRAPRRVEHQQAWTLGDTAYPEEETNEEDGPADADAPVAQQAQYDAHAQEEEEGNQVFTQVSVTVPAVLSEYYKTLRRAPVTKLYELIEGVMVLNQVKELDAALLFPLLRSAALKVRLGAFLSPYEDVGVASEDIIKAYRELSETLSFAEEL